MIHHPFATLRSSSPNQFVPEIVSPLPCSSGLVLHTVYLFFQKNSFLALAPLTNATPACSTLRSIQQSITNFRLPD